jgi:ribonucleoside-diphosphate reductase alpha chain
MYKYDETLQECVEYFGGDQLAAKVFVDKYALQDNDGNILENSPEQMHRRLAKEFARIESKKYKNTDIVPLTEQEIFDLFDRFKYLIPGGRILFGLGNKYQYCTMSNCYVIPLHDSYPGIMTADQDLINISRRGGGVGLDISSLRPAGSSVRNAAKASTGAVSFMSRFSHSIREVCQCVEENQRVLTNKGLVPIRLVENGDMVWTKQGWVDVKNRIGPNKKDVYELRTKAGYSIKLSKEHVLLSYSGKKLIEKQVCDIKINDRVCLLVGNNISKEVPKLTGYDYTKKTFSNRSNRLHKNINKPKELGGNLAYILGYIYGNGYIEFDKFDEPRCLSISCPTNRPNIIEKICSIILTEFNYEPPIKKGGGACICIGIYSKEILNYLQKNYILKSKADIQTFPALLLNACQSIQLAFIAGYLDADGEASKRGGFRISSTNCRFLEQIQTVLLANGIISKVRLDREERGNWKPLYRLCIVGRLSMQTTIKLMVESIKIQGKKHIPNRDNWLTPYTSRELGVKYGDFNFCTGPNSLLSTGCLLQLKEQGLNLPETLFLDEVVSIELKDECLTYDLNLDKEHFFWCEGFYVHNSGRRGAAMLTMSVHHPEIENFIMSKSDSTSVTGANISIRLTDEFLSAVKNESDYELRWPVDSDKPSISTTISAAKIWNMICNNAAKYAEPGILFWDRIIKESPADSFNGYKTIGCNPCSELPLSAYDSCRLMSINLFGYIDNPFTHTANFNTKLFNQYAKLATRLMDDLIDLELESIDRIIHKVENDPEPVDIKNNEINLWKSIRKSCNNGRRLGIGLTAIGDAMAALNIKYGGGPSIKFIDEVFRDLKYSCYEESVNIAKELSPFPAWKDGLDNNCPFIVRFNDDIRGSKLLKNMKKYGRRNIGLLTCAPSGTISCLARTTSGIEPCFQLKYKRRKKIVSGDKNIQTDFVDKNGDQWQEFEVYHPKFLDWMQITGKKNIEESPWFGCCANDIDWKQRVKLQAKANLHLDHSISSTVNVPEQTTVDDVKKIFETAWESGCKGITVYRQGSRDGVLLLDNSKKEAIIKKRPRELPCDVFHVAVQGQKYFILVGLLDGPYEIFAGKGGGLAHTIKSGKIIKKRKGVYKFEGDDAELSPITAFSSDTEEAIGRLVSALLREKVDLNFVVGQLEKVGQNNQEMNSFSKALARVLKKYIKDGVAVIGEACPECGGSMVRRDGCKVCELCQYQACS